ncbi:MAG: GerAB/ArcD/ProY family transporter [Clostridia bacterium]|nr:GerAB/ArcD/ProY family transporter [Clostridia bacterium]
MSAEQPCLSVWQVAALSATTAFSSAVLFTPAMAARTSGRDAWLAALAGGAGTALFVVLWTELAQRCPEGPVEGVRARVGELPSAIVGLLYAWFFLRLATLVLRETTAVFGVMMPETPSIVFTGLMASAAAYAVWHGIEAIARATLILLAPLVLVLVAIIGLVPPGNLHLDRLLPVLERGVGPVLVGALQHAGWFGEMVICLWLLPMSRDRRAARAVLWASAGALAVSAAALTALATATLGPYELAREFVPTLTLVRLINLAGFVQRLDAVLISAWALGTLVKLSVLFHLTAAALATGLALPRQRLLAVLTGATAVAFSHLLLPTTARLEAALDRFFRGDALFFEAALPAALLFLLAVLQPHGGAGRQRSAP